MITNLSATQNVILLFFSIIRVEMNQESTPVTLHKMGIHPDRIPIHLTKEHAHTSKHSLDLILKLEVIVVKSKKARSKESKSCNFPNIAVTMKPTFAMKT